MANLQSVLDDIRRLRRLVYLVVFRQLLFSVLPMTLRKRFFHFILDRLWKCSLFVKFRRYFGDQSVTTKSIIDSTPNGNEPSTRSKEKEDEEMLEEPRPCRLSHVDMAEILLPSQADGEGIAFSGVLMEWIDIAAGLSAKSHTKRPCVTASLDAVHFLAPVTVGQVVVLKACVNRAWRTSLEVGYLASEYQCAIRCFSVRVEAEDMLTGERKYCCHAYLTFVALKDGKPVPVPPVVPEDDMERLWYASAQTRRQERFQRRASYAATNFHEEREAGELYLPGAAFQFGSMQNISFDDTSCGKPTTASYTQNVQMVMPQHANALSITFGGHIIGLMEHCAIIAASRHAHPNDSKSFSSTASFPLSPSSSSQSLKSLTTFESGQTHFRTASIDSLSFLRPTFVGTWRRSMEVYVTVHAESGYTDPPREDVPAGYRFTNDGYLTIVAMTETQPTVSRALSERKSETKNNEGQEDKEGKEGRRWCVPSVFAVTESEKDRYVRATSRREKRLLERDEIRKNFMLTQQNNSSAHNYKNAHSSGKNEWLCGMEEASVVWRYTQ